MPRQGFTQERSDSFDEAARYINAIRNQKKQAYAREYWRYLRGFAKESPYPDQFTPLSYMAMQAVRLQLQDYFNVA